MWRSPAAFRAVFRGLSGVLLLFIVAAGLVCSPAPLSAAPFAKHVQFTQPDSQQITLWGVGDEFQAVFETTTGYTVVFDPRQQAYFYATLSDDGQDLLSTGVYAHRQAPTSLAQHVRIDPGAAAASARERRNQWKADTGLAMRWSHLKSQTLGTPLASDASGGVTAPPSSPTLGSKVGLTLLIDFPDVPATIDRSEIESFLNGDAYTGYNNNGSVKQYFSDVSTSLLTYTNVVTIYVRMTQPKSYYNNTAKSSGTQGRLLINDALAILKARSDYNDTILPTFDSLTTDGAGNVAALNVYFAGSDSGVWSYGLWPHSWVLASPVSLGNGKSVWRYQITDVGTSLELGTFCHENGHMLCGFPDLYDYGYDSVGGAGVFSLMGYGGSGTNPKQVDAYLKSAAGWATVTDLDGAAVQTGTLAAAPASGYNSFYRYRRPGVATEYFILENRQKTGRDAGLPSAGIAVWHVDELGDRDNQSMTPNTAHRNYELTLVQADNLWHFERYLNSGDAADLYYLGNAAAAYTNRLDDTSAPNAHWWDGSASGMILGDFTAPGISMGFHVGTTGTPPVAVATAIPASGTAPLTVSFDGSGSSDPDGTVVSHAWSFGDGTSTSGPLVSHTYAAAGTYTATLTVTDNSGLTASTTVSISVAAPPVTTAIHIGDLDAARSATKKSWTAKVTITVHDAAEHTVGGATISGTWSTGGSGSCTTSNRGLCSVSRNGIPLQTSSTVFTVTGVTRASATYAPSANHDSDGGSDGTTITVAR